MPELLLELFSEEIPARMQMRAAAELERQINQRFMDAGFMPEGVKAFAGPRRLIVVATGLPAQQPDRREEKKGPRAGAPEKAIAGFLKSTGISSLDQCETRKDKKGAYYVAVIEQRGKPTTDLIAEFIPEIMGGFAWPKSMSWGSSSSDDGDFKWVRPIHSILCTFDAEIVDFEIGGVSSGDKTQGHRFMASDDIQVRGFDEYAAKLRAANVILDNQERREIIARDAATLCKAQGLELVADTGLLNEVAGLAEWPVAIMGAFDEKFLALPDEVLTASMRGHQKYFSVNNPKIGALANRFICIANIEAAEGGAAMREGYERVLSARLSDGWYLYNQDLKKPLADRIDDLDKVTFFEGLGSVGDKARRVAALAKEIAPAVGADPETAERAAMLAKADLVTGMVYEFPELQGVMGRYYAQTQGEPAEIADAIRDHYKPSGQDDDVPTAPVSVAVALADKIDTLTAFWAIGEKPTGSKDPFALRRAALGVIGIVLNEYNRVRISLRDILFMRVENVFTNNIKDEYLQEYKKIEEQRLLNDSMKKESIAQQESMWESETFKVFVFDKSKEITDDLLEFFHGRLKVYFRDNGYRHDNVSAVLRNPAGKLEDDFVLINRKLNALEGFLEHDDGINLAAAYKRAANILKAEEKKDGAPADPAGVKASLLRESQEKLLFAGLADAEAKVEKAVAAEDFEAAMTALASLRAPLDAFFEKVTVNADDHALRANRLSLLARLRAATAKVADFSKLEG